MRPQKFRLPLVVAALIISLCSCSSEEPVTVSAARTNAENAFWPRHVVAEGYMNQTVVAADFTGDGLADVISNGDCKTWLYVAPDWTEVIIEAADPPRKLIHSEVTQSFGPAPRRGPVCWLARRGEWGLSA